LLVLVGHPAPPAGVPALTSPFSVRTRAGRALRGACSSMAERPVVSRVVRVRPPPRTPPLTSPPCSPRIPTAVPLHVRRSLIRGLGKGALGTDSRRAFSFCPTSSHSDHKFRVTVSGSG